MNIKKINIKSLLFKNTGIKQTIFKNTFWLIGAEGVSKLLKIVLIIYVARIFGALNYGIFTFSLAFVTLFAVFFDMGLGAIITREFSDKGGKEEEFLAIFSLKILLGAMVLFLIFVGSFFISQDLVIRKIIWILGIYIMITELIGTIFVFFRSRQQMEHEAWMKIFQIFTETSIGLFIILNFPSVQNLSYSYLVASFITLFVVLLFFNFKVFPLKFYWEKSIWKKFLRMSWPVALVGVFATIYSQIDSVMMGYWGQIIETGWYNAAYRLVSMIMAPATLIGISFFPVLSKTFKESKEEFQKIGDYQMQIIIFFAIPVMVGGIALAPKIVNCVYGQTYSSAILAFQILIIMAGFTFFSNLFSNILIAVKKQKNLSVIIFSGAVLNIILNVLLIPRYTLYGAAVSTLITMVLILVLFLGFVPKLTPFKIFNLNFLINFLGACISSLIMYFFVSKPEIYCINIFVLILIGILLYSISFLLYKKIINRLFFQRI
jgi:O-antigen/teichoic acid export membrane protein